MTTFGHSVRRVEDADLLTGRAGFVDDLAVSKEALHLTVLRSPFAHATVRINSLPLSPGVLAMTVSDVSHLEWNQLLPGPPPLRALAGDRTRYVGEPIAAFVTDDREQGVELAAAVDVDYEPLPAATTVERALAADAPLVYEDLGTNVAYRDESSHNRELFADADVVIRRTFRNHRIAPGMMEPRAITAVPDGDGVTVYVSHQHAHKLRNELAAILQIDDTEVRVVVPEVGGGFGAKSSLYPEYVLVAHAALVTGHPVKFIESRSENLAVTAHGRDQVQHVEVGATADGDLVGLRVGIDANFGAAIDLQRWSIALTRRMLSGAYRIPTIEWSMRGVFTHTAPLGAFRGAGRPEAAYLIERVMDELARELSVDSAELRMRNFVPASEFPYATGTDVTYDSGDYHEALRCALEEAGYAELRREQRERRQSMTASLLGIGLATYVEMTAGGEEYAEVEVDGRGDFTVRTGTSPHGQGHDTTWAQLAADRVGLPVDRATVIHGDTSEVPRGGGTSGSRSAVLGGSAVAEAADRVADLLREMAAERLEAAAGDIGIADGRAVVAGTDIGVDIAELVAAHGEPVMASETFVGKGQTFPFGSHVCAIEIDLGTGEIEIVRYVAVDDCGRVINPMVVEGQLFGGALQGISHALAEEVIHDEAGQLLTGTLASYSLPPIGSAPQMTFLRTETPSPLNPLGLKGVGESGVTGATPAVANAVYDALASLGIDGEALTMPFTPGKVWAAMAGGLE